MIFIAQEAVSEAATVSYKQTMKMANTAPVVSDVQMKDEKMRVDTDAHGQKIITTNSRSAAS